MFHGDIAKIQRRSNFRTHLPDDWTRDLKIEQIEDQLENVKGTILDLSLGGCLFICKNPGPLVSEDKVYGEIKILEFPTIRFKGVIRRASHRPDGTIFGLEFSEVEGQGNQYLNTITLKAARAQRGYI